MGKRTLQMTGQTHAPRPRDFWSTIDPKARKALVPHLPRGVRYREPMAGDGSLVRLLGPELNCVGMSDLKPQAPGIEELDVFDAQIGDADMWLSNPPWTRKLLHRIIVHLSDQAPAWLLFDADWMNTDQAGRFSSRCRRIVYTGRLIWIAGTTNPGFTACCWYLFDKPMPRSAPTFYPHGVLPRTPYTPASRPDVNFHPGELFAHEIAALSTQPEADQ